MHMLTRTLITTFPLLCAAGVAAAPAAAHPDGGTQPARRPPTAEVAPSVPHHRDPSPKCAEGGTWTAVVATHPSERVGQAIRPAQQAGAPGTVPIAPHGSKPPSNSPGTPAAGRPAGDIPVAVVLGAAVAVELPPRPSPNGMRGASVPGQMPQQPSITVPCGREPTVVPVIVPRRELVPAPVPVQVTIHDLGSAPARPQGIDQSAGARSEIEVLVRVGDGSGSATELPAVVREMLRSLAPQHRVPTPRPHR
ncbi:hypothetical protein [Nocardia alba]|nr:hypothetical protein [Nocardia alba]